MTGAEAVLVHAAAAGDSRAAAELIASVRPGIVRYCRASLGPLAGAYTTADDVSSRGDYSLRGFSLDSVPRMLPRLWIPSLSAIALLASSTTAAYSDACSFVSVQ